MSFCHIENSAEAVADINIFNYIRMTDIRFAVLSRHILVKPSHSWLLKQGETLVVMVKVNLSGIVRRSPCLQDITLSAEPVSCTSRDCH